MKEDLKRLSIEELHKKKQLKGITAFFIGILIVGLAASLYLAITEKKIYRWPRCSVGPGSDPAHEL